MTLSAHWLELFACFQRDHACWIEPDTVFLSIHADGLARCSVRERLSLRAVKLSQVLASRLAHVRVSNYCGIRYGSDLATRAAGTPNLHNEDCAECNESNKLTKHFPTRLSRPKNHVHSPLIGMPEACSSIHRHPSQSPMSS